MKTEIETFLLIEGKLVICTNGIDLQSKMISIKTFGK